MPYIEILYKDIRTCPPDAKKPPHEREKPSWKLTSFTKTQKGTTKVELFSKLRDVNRKRQLETTVETQKLQQPILNYQKSKVMKTLKVNQIEKNRLSAVAMGQIRGGEWVPNGNTWECGCGCAGAGGSSIEANGMANAKTPGGLTSRGEIKIRYAARELEWI